MDIDIETVVVIVGIALLALVSMYFQHRCAKHRTRDFDRIKGRLHLERIDPEDLERDLNGLRLLDAPGFVAHYVENGYDTLRGDRRIMIFDHEMRRMNDSLAETVVAGRLRSADSPQLWIRPMTVVEQYLGAASPDADRIRFENDKLFDTRYYVRGEQRVVKNKLINEKVRQSILKFDKGMSVEVDRGWVLVYRKEKLLSAPAIAKAIEFTVDFAKLLDDTLLGRPGQSRQTDQEEK